MTKITNTSTMVEGLLQKQSYKNLKTAEFILLNYLMKICDFLTCKKKKKKTALKIKSHIRTYTKDFQQLIHKTLDNTQPLQIVESFKVLKEKAIH